MKYSEMVNSIKEDYDSFVDIMEKCEVFSDLLIREYDESSLALELSILEEKSSEETNENSEAEEGFIEKAKKIISTICSAVASFINNIIRKIKNFFHQSHIKKIFDAVKKSHVEGYVKFKNPEENVSIGEKALSRIYSYISKLKMERPISSKEINDACNYYPDKKTNWRDVVVVSISTAAAIDLIDKYSNKIDKFSVDKDNIDESEKAILKIGNVGISRLLIKITNSAAKIIFDILGGLTDAIETLFDGICKNVGIKKEQSYLDIDLSAKKLNIYKERSCDNYNNISDNEDKLFKNILLEAERRVEFDPDEELLSLESEIDSEYSTNYSLFNEFKDYDDYFMRELFLAIETSKDIIPISNELLFVEAKNNEELRKVNEENEETKKGVFSHLKNAFNSIIEAITKMINNLAKFFRGDKGITGNEEEFKKAYNEACKRNPALKNKKVEVSIFDESNKEYEDLIKELEDADRKIASGQNFNVESLLKKVNDKLSSTKSAVTKTILVEEMINLSAYNTNLAKIISSSLNNNKDLLESLEKSFGKRGTEKIQKEINSYTKRGLIQRMKIKIRGRQYKDLIETQESIIKGAKDFIKLDDTPESRKLWKRFASTNEIGELSQKATEFGLKTANDLGVSLVNGKTFTNSIRGVGNSIGSKLGLVDKKGALRSAYDDYRKEQKRVRKREAKGDYSTSGLGTLFRHEVDSLSNRR